VILAFVTVMAGAIQAAQEKQYGTALTLKEVTKISDIHANPEKFSEKRVQVEGPIVGVCSHMGCWVELGSDKESQTLRFKVDDGVIVFPVTLKGRNAKVEGVISVETLSVEEQVRRGEEMAREMKTTFDPKTVTGPKTTIQIKGEGAIVY
jgi:hypothetical protein